VVEVVFATVDHPDIRGSKPHNRDPSGAASDYKRGFGPQTNGTGQRVRLIVDQIEEVEAEQSAKRGIPVWVPQNCPSSSKTD
jgi:hypothetical protein